MELVDFKKCLHKFFINHGFKKIKNKYYRNGKGFLCVIHFYSSHYWRRNYVDYYFFLGDFEEPYVINQENIETYTPYVGHRFYFTEIDTYSCEYLKYHEAQLISCLEQNMQQRIIPPFEVGKKYLRDNFGAFYTSILDDDKIKVLLNN